MSAPAAAIAAGPPTAYLRGVSLTRLIRFLTILALVLSPVAMLGGGPAQASSHHMMMASQAADMAMEHCHDAGEKSKDRSAPSMDCAMACAAMMPELGDQLDGLPSVPAGLQAPAPVTVGHGLVPEAADPPPRTA